MTMAPCVRSSWPWLVSGALLLGSGGCQLAQAVEFDASFLQLQGGERLDLARLAQGPLPPGRYELDLWLNDQSRGRHPIRIDSGGASPLHPCLTAALLAQLGIRPPEDPALQQALADPRACPAPESLDPLAQWRYDGNQLALYLTLPQARLLKSPANTGPWQRGITAGLLQYDLNQYHYGTSERTTDQRYLGLEGGLNWQAWRLRHRSTLSQRDQAATDWNNLETNLWRSLPSWQSRLTLGQANTQGQFFDSLGYRGVSLAADPRMLSDQAQGFAPQIRGQARSHARISVHQQGRLLYQTTVPPGEFVIDDLYATGYGGDLEVTVLEADGSQQTFTVANNGLPQLLRAGQHRFALTLGRTDVADADTQAALLEGSWHQGLSNLASVYLGSQLSEHYSAGLWGLALNSPWGALALDLTAAVPHEDQTRQRWRARYSRQWTDTDTHLTITGQHYRQPGYQSLADSLRRSDSETTPDPWQGDSPHNRLDLTMNQPLGRLGGSLYLSGSWLASWEHHRQWYGQLGYQRQWGPVGLNLSASRSGASSWSPENRYQLTLSLPLGQQAYPQTLNLMLNHSSSQHWQSQAYLSGSGGPLIPWSYGLSTARWQESGQTHHTLGANGQWRGQKLALSGSVSGDNQQQRQYSLGARGALLLHPDGLLASRDLGESIAIIQAPGAAGAHLRSWPDIQLDADGIAVAPYLTPFRQNTLELDPAGMDPNVELLSTQQQVSPDAGAVMLLQFASRQGFPVLLSAALADGQPLPFGAQVRDEQGEAVGAVIQGGQLYARVNSRQGRLLVSWGEQTDAQCQLSYQLPARPNAAALYLPPTPLRCQALPQENTP
ncbi:fimbria/pilus outer membrane usher protein [Pseudaeromonas sp. ZJS20]|uniref:fimbria/pilus outer membrane usher protein n=1 Tax=Pseudaeromonas aegiceratis TaxID=3153928 RepID=UPI00390C8DE4